MINGLPINITIPKMRRGQSNIEDLILQTPEKHFINFGNNYYQMLNTDPQYHQTKSKTVKITLNNQTFSIPNLLYKDPNE